MDQDLLRRRLQTPPLPFPSLYEPEALPDRLPRAESSRDFETVGDVSMPLSFLKAPSSSRAALRLETAY
jgi:hypothetical protein